MFEANAPLWSKLCLMGLQLHCFHLLYKRFFYLFVVGLMLEGEQGIRVHRNIQFYVGHSVRVSVNQPTRIASRCSAAVSTVLVLGHSFM